MKKIAILGSTGSIGRQALEIIRANEDYCVTALAAGNNIDLLEEQIREFHPSMVSVMDSKKAVELIKRCQDIRVDILSGIEGMITLAYQCDAQMVLTAVVGMIGIRPTIAAIEAGKDIALANKETLVCAGHLIMPLAKGFGAKVYPVDSEHSAVFQALNGEEGNPVEKIILTASGGPFFGKTKEELSHVTIAQALAHPNWSMGQKITIDSATLVNKGLEIMEAKWLFDVEPDRIEVVIHPQSVIHSAVQFADGAVIAQMGTPDMKLPIQYAFSHPERRPLNQKRLNLFELGHLDFARPDEKTFTGLALAKEAIRQGGNMPTVYNAANETAVELFLAGKIAFLQIAELIEAAMEHIPFADQPDLTTILSTEQAVRSYLSQKP